MIPLNEKPCLWLCRWTTIVGMQIANREPSATFCIGIALGSRPGDNPGVRLWEGGALFYELIC